MARRLSRQRAYTTENLGIIFVERCRPMTPAHLEKPPRLRLNGIMKLTMNGPGELRRLHPQLPGFPDTICLLYRADLHRTRAAMTLKDNLVAYGRTLQRMDPNEDSILPP